MIEFYRYAVKVSYPDGDETFLQSATYSSSVSARQGAELYVSMDSAQKAISRFKKKFPGMVERGAIFSYIPVSVRFRE
jgi:uncharacterized protein YegP (UPF0339 family)